MNRIDGSVIQRWLTVILLLAGIPLVLNILRIGDSEVAIATSATATEQSTPTPESTIKVEIQEPVELPVEQLEPIIQPTAQPIEQDAAALNCTWSPNFRDKSNPEVTRPPSGALIKYNAWEPSGRCHIPLYEYWNGLDDFKYNTGTDAEIIVLEPISYNSSR